MDVRYRFFVNSIDDALSSGFLAMFCDADHIPAALGYATEGRFLHPLWIWISLGAGLYLIFSNLLEVVIE